MRAAGAHSSAYAVDLATGQVLLSVRATTARSPASVEKLYTTSVALSRFGAAGTLQTTVEGAGSPDATGVWHGDLYLHGGGDPTFGSQAFVSANYGSGATVQALARALIANLHLTRIDGSVLGDESLFDALRGEPSSGYAPDPFLTGTLSALAFNRGQSGNQGSPAAYAAYELAGALRSDGVKVSGPSGAAVAPPGTPVLASVSSPPMSTLVGLTTLESDNFFAETLVKDLGAYWGGAGTTRAGATTVRAWLKADVGITPQVVDGSGLSTYDRTSPLQLVTFLSALWPQGGRLAAIGVPLAAGLPLAGRSGTLSSRMRSGPAAGRCQAKTGTLTGYSSLAGWCDGRFAFALLTDGIDTTSAHVVQDRIVQALAGLA